MIFVSVFFIVSVTTHFFLYRFAVRSLGLTHPAGRALMLAAFAVLALSFMAAFFLIRWDENPFTIGFYKISAVWFALSINLLLAASSTWLLYGGLRVCGVSTASFRVLAAACVLLGLAGSARGFWNALHPGMTPVEVRLENLPEAWRDKTIVQLSDVHLGHFHTAAAMERLAKRVNALAPDMVVITGDLFDGMIDGLPGFAEPLKRLSAHKGVYFVTGNHEVYAGLRRSLDIVARAGIRVLFNEVVEIDGLNLMGIAYPGVANEREIRGVERLTPPGPDHRPCILLFHTPTDIRHDGALDRRTATYWRPDTSFALSKKLGVSLQISGHTHRGQIFPFGLLTRWIFNGYDYGLHREKGFAIYASSGVGTWGPPMRTGTSPEIVVFTLRAAS
ncbi:MAG TPA: metallophosphoesterase [Desulfobacterales bacterium]|nr:metallophosphoesterase [Desulfobacterales bacterium]